MANQKTRNKSGGAFLKHKLFSNLALDRILDIAEEPVTFIANDRYDFNEYFEDVIGVRVTDNEDPVKVVLWFNPLAASNRFYSCQNNA